MIISNTGRQRLRIALVAPLVTPIAPPFVGGAQVMLHDLARKLVARGHAVTLYAAQGSQVSGVRVIEMPVQSGELALADLAHQGAGGAAVNAVFYKQANLFLDIFMDINRRAYDIVHAHAFDWPVFAYAPLCAIPTVHTVHLPALDDSINQAIRTVHRRTGSSNCVTVSEACAATYQHLFPFDRVIHNGIATENIPFHQQPDDYVLFVGRMSPEKGPDIAIDIARRAGKKLLMAGGIYDQSFFDARIQPLLEQAGSQVEYLGALDREQVYALMSRASGLLFTSTWSEPFGLVLAEAQATGTPVIAFDSGAAREVVRHGETGFVVPIGDYEGAAAAVSHLGGLNRMLCRQHIEAHFSLDAMADAYEAYYRAKLSEQFSDMRTIVIGTVGGLAA